MILGANLEAIPEQIRPIVVSLHNDNVSLREENNRLRRIAYGGVTEKHVSGEVIEPKGSLFNEAELESGQVLPEPAVDTPVLPKKTRRGGTAASGGRRPFPEELPRERREVDLSEAEKICPHDGTPLVRIGEDVVEKLDFVPASLKVVQFVSPKYACETCKQHVARAEMPPAALPQAMCEAGLVAHVLEEKYLYGMPLYRLEQKFDYLGMELSRASLARWVIQAADLLGDLAFEIKNAILKGDVLHADETTVQVLKGTGKKPTATSYMWTLCNAAPAAPAVWYQYEPSRSGQAAASLLGSFSGLAHVDGFEGYSPVFAKNGTTRIGCWAHARRPFDCAKKDGSPGGRGLASLFLDDIQELFLIERDLQNQPPDERLLMRQERSAPVVERLRSRLLEERHKVPPKSKLGGALTYLDNQWETLVVFLKDGRAELSNNRMERFIRPFTIGRKAWIFSDTAQGAHASALIYSVVVTAKANGQNVGAYLAFLLRELPLIYANRKGRIDFTPYLPWNWKPDPAPA